MSERLQRLRAERAQLETSTAEIESSSKADQNRLTSEIQTLRTDLEASQEQIKTLSGKSASQRDFIQSAPTETQLLKLERRLESAKGSLAEAIRARSQLNTGIDAYRERSRACWAARLDLHEALELGSVSAFAETAASVDAELQHKASDVTLSAIDSLIAICEDRESALLELNQRYAEKLEEDAKISERMALLQSNVEAELPRIEAEAGRFINEITACWSKEKEALQQVYERLYAVNKEQQFHLLRGTHVKRGPSESSNHEQALSARHAKLTADLIDARARLQDLAAENLFSKRTTDQLRAEGRESVVRFEAIKREVADRLKQAQFERSAAETESKRFRNLKNELHDALQAIRETPSGSTKTA